jgi:uncharacterized membrane protein
MKKSILVKLTGFCLGLLLVRIAMSSNFSFIFMFWNLFLAWLPYYFIKRYSKTTSKIKQVCFFLLSILFLPNAPYIITDLFHLHQNPAAPMWLDLLLILSFAMLGLSYFILSVKEILLIAADYIPNKASYMMVKVGIMLLSAYGIYLGRFLRFNSWDVLTDPLNLIDRIFHSLCDNSQIKETLSITLSFAIFLFLIYELYESLRYEKSEPKKLFEKTT